MLLLTALPLFSQIIDSVANPIVANGFIERMDRYLGFKMSLTNDFEAFTINDGDYKCRIQPNTNIKTRFSVNYRFISLAIGLHPDFIARNRDEDEKGETKTTNIYLKLNFNHWNQNLYYNRNVGYYVDEIAGVANINTNEGYIQLPELTYWAIGGSTSYKIKEGLSLRALRIQTERQLKSAGSFIPTLSYKYYVIDTKDSIPGFSAPKHFNNFEITTSISYYYTKVFRHYLYASLGVEPGIGLTNNNITTYHPDSKEINNYFYPIYRALGDASVGYNGKRFFMGAQVTLSLSSYNPNSSNSLLINDKTNYQIFIGYRFNAPHQVKTITDKAEDTGTKILDELH
jgi:hypothetical protein